MTTRGSIFGRRQGVNFGPSLTALSLHGPQGHARRTGSCTGRTVVPGSTRAPLGAHGADSATAGRRRYESVRPPARGPSTVDGGSTPQPRYRHGLPSPLFLGVQTPGSASCTGWAVRAARPPHLRPLWHAERSCRCASRLLLRAGTGGGMDGMRAQRQVALRGLTAPTHRRPRSSGRAGLPAQAPARLAADVSARGTSSDDGRPPTTPASREVAFCTLPPRRHAPSAAIEGDCGP
jgi:hypothetical protein